MEQRPLNEYINQFDLDHPHILKLKLQIIGQLSMAEMSKIPLEESNEGN